MNVPKHFDIRDSDEFIRLIALGDIAVGDSPRITLDARMVCIKGICHLIPAHIPAQLAEDGWLVRCETQFSGSMQYGLNPDREEEWTRAEDARIQRCQQLLKERYPTCTFTKGSYAVLQHCACTDHDARGFLFHDADGHAYLVTDGGGVIHIPSIVTL